MKPAVILGLTTLLAAFSGGSAMSDSAPADATAARKQMEKKLNDGNFKDAYEGFSQAGLGPATTIPGKLRGDLNRR